MAMSDTFQARIDQLAERVGLGPIGGTVEVDQIYAHRQHFELGWNHPQGGEAMYLTNPLYERINLYMEILAEGALDSPETAMIMVVEDLAQQVAERAPLEFGFLRESAHPSVRSEGFIIYDRPPLQPRLTEAELVTLHELRYGETHSNLL